MERNEVKISSKSKFRKMDPLLWDFSPSGTLKIVRWTPQRVAYRANKKPNAIAVEDLPAGCVAVVEINNGFAEVRAK